MQGIKKIQNKFRFGFEVLFFEVTKYVCCIIIIPPPPKRSKKSLKSPNYIDVHDEFKHVTTTVLTTTLRILNMAKV